jgi:hypothetical protein
MNDQDLTDLFAGMAIQGLLAADSRTPLVSELAEYAYDIAEAMVEERALRLENASRIKDHGSGIMAAKKYTRKSKKVVE